MKKQTEEEEIALVTLPVNLLQENLGVQVDPEDILRLLEASQKVTDYPVYLIPPLFSPLASTSLMGKCPFLQTPFPVTKTMFLCIHYWANNNMIQKAVRPIYHLKCRATHRYYTSAAIWTNDSLVLNVIFELRPDLESL